MKAIVIGGPTGVGKTALSLRLAKELDAEIISVDSMQVYKYMNIGTAKILESEMEGIPHHMIDLVEPTYKFSVGEYYNLSEKVFKDLEERGKNAIIVGGTGLYISAISRGLANLPTSDEKLRKSLEKLSSLELQDKLRELDVDASEEIHGNNRVRLIRAIEVCLLSGEKFSELKEKNVKNNSYEFYNFALERDRQYLYNRIDKRVDIMFEMGLLEEVQSLYKNYKDGIEKIRAIGYVELFSYFDGELSLEDAKELIKKNSRNYAKRQFTWFKNQDSYKWFNLDIESEEEVLNKILKEIK